MRTIYAFALCSAFAMFSALGCSDAQQLEHAEDELVEERQETRETAQDAVNDGVVTQDESEEVREEQGETVEAAGEVVEQQGELVEGKVD